MTTRLLFTDGEKSITLDNYPDEAWVFYSGAPKTNLDEYFRSVPWLYRGITKTAGAVSGVPWALVRGGNDVDDSSQNDNPTGLLPNLSVLCNQVALSLELYGRAYLLKERNRLKVTKLRYLAPSTIEVEIDAETGEPRFIRQVNNKRYDYTADDIIYFWLPDPSREIGPPGAWPAKAALHASGVLANLDVFVESYFKRGAIRATLVSADGLSDKAERERLESWFTKLMNGITNAFRWKIFNANRLNVQTIGDGIDSLQDNDLTLSKRQDISTALGIPFAMLFSDSANYATAQEDKLNYYDETVVPLFEFIIETLNVQLLDKLGYHLESRHATMDIYQVDEQSRSASLGQLVTALAASPQEFLIAASILGYEIPDDDLLAIQALISDKEERRDTMAEMVQPQNVEPEEDDEEEEPPRPVRQRGDRDRWKAKALKYFKAGRALDFDFVTNEITPDEQDRIKAQLLNAGSLADIVAIFDAPPEPSAIEALLEGIRLGISALSAEVQ